MSGEAPVTVLLGDPRLPDETKPDARYTPEDVEAVARLKQALAGLDEPFEYIDEHDGLLQRLSERPPAFVLNFCDTGFRNRAWQELHVCALLEMLDIAYSGAGPTCLALCFDKAAVRAIAEGLGIPVPRERLLPAESDAAPRAPGYPAIVKPRTGDGSYGITADGVVHDDDRLAARVATLRAELPGRDLLVQEFLGGRELAIGLIGNPHAGFHVLTPLEVDYSGLDPDLPRILGYESKTLPESPYWQQLRYAPAALPRQALDGLVDLCATLFRRLGCRDYARFDFREDDSGLFRLLEVNPNPAWCWDGKLNLMAGFEGLDYGALLALILDAARARGGSAARPAAHRRRPLHWRAAGGESGAATD